MHSDVPSTTFQNIFLAKREVSIKAFVESEIGTFVTNCYRVFKSTANNMLFGNIHLQVICSDCGILFSGNHDEDKSRSSGTLSLSVIFANLLFGLKCV